MTIARDCLSKIGFTPNLFASAVLSLKTFRSSYRSQPKDVPIIQSSYSVYLFISFLTPGNTQNLPAKAGGAHQPANNVQQCHQQAKEMSARPALQLEQVRNSSL